LSFAAIFNRLTPIVNLLYKKCLSEGKREVKMIKKTSKSDFSLNKSPNGGVKLIRSGIPGMDDLLKGGIREGSAVLVSGGPGTGKTILALQFLIEGAKNGEPSLLVVYDTGDGELLDHADTLGLELRKYVESGMITLLKQDVLIKKVPSLAVPLDMINQKKIKRVALDSLTMFSYIHVSDDKDYRLKIVNFLESMKNITLMATAEASGLNIDEVNFRPEDFMFDGVVFLTKIRQEASFERVIHVSKMRGQDHQINVYPFSIGQGGITVYPNQLPFSLLREEGKNKR